MISEGLHLQECYWYSIRHGVGYTGPLGFLLQKLKAGKEVAFAISINAFYVSSAKRLVYIY